MAVREEDASVFNPHVGASARVTLHSSESHRATPSMPDYRAIVYFEANFDL
jgi:hypothetical protein